MDDDDLLGAMLDFEDNVSTGLAAVPPRSAAPQRQAQQGHTMPRAVPHSPVPLPNAVLSPSGATSRPSSSSSAAASAPTAMHMGLQHYRQLMEYLFRTVPEKQAEMSVLYGRYKADLGTATSDQEQMQVMYAMKEKVKRLYGTQRYEQAKAQVAKLVVSAAAQKRATPPPSLTAGAPPAPVPSPAHAPTPATQQQQQQQARQQQGQQGRVPSPSPGAAGRIVTGQPALTAAVAAAAGTSQALQQQIQQAQQQIAIQQQAVAAAAATAKRADTSEQPAVKRVKVGGGGGGGVAKRKDDDAGLTVDGLIDFDQETNQLMEGLQRARMEGRLGFKTTSNQQFLSEWRVGNEFYRQIQRTGGGMGVKGECLELVQLAFQAHMSGVVARALRCALHRQDAPRRSADMMVTSDPRRGVTQIERREKVKAEAKLEAERTELLRLAGSKRADDETKERAQKAKAELVGKQQASLANAAVAATLGGKSKSKVNKWDKWSSAAAAGPAAGEGEGGAAAPAKCKRGGGKKGGKKDAAAATAVAAADSEGGGTEGEGGGASDASGAADKPGAAAKAPARGRLMGGATPGSDDASTVHLQDVIGTLERDPLYSRSGMLYRLYNAPRAVPASAPALP